jgi:N6-L-threonylcarbamoyladenine synthase
MVAALAARVIMDGGSPSDLAFAPDSSLPVTSVSV